MIARAFAAIQRAVFQRQLASVVQHDQAGAVGTQGMAVQIDGEVLFGKTYLQHRAVAQIKIIQQRDGPAVLDGIDRLRQRSVFHISDLCDRRIYGRTLLNGHDRVEAAAGAHLVLVLVHIDTTISQKFHAVAAGGVGGLVHLPENAFDILVCCGIHVGAERTAFQCDLTFCTYVQSLIVAAFDDSRAEVAHRHTAFTARYCGGHVFQRHVRTGSVRADGAAAASCGFYCTVLHRYGGIFDQQNAVR